MHTCIEEGYPLPLFLPPPVPSRYSNCICWNDPDNVGRCWPRALLLSMCVHACMRAQHSTSLPQNLSGTSYLPAPRASPVSLSIRGELI